MKTKIILVCTLVLMLIGCFGPHLYNKNTEVSGHIVLSKIWAIDLPETFDARIEQGAMVYRKPGFTVRLTVKNNPHHYSVEELYDGINRTKPPEAFDVASKDKQNVKTLSYRLYEPTGNSEAAEYYGFVFSEAGYIKLVIFFDNESDVQLARTIHDNVIFSKA